MAILIIIGAIVGFAMFVGAVLFLGFLGYSFIWVPLVAILEIITGG